MAATPPVVVYGATGFTGRLVCKELARRGLAFSAAARSRGKLDALASELAVDLPTATASVDDAASLRAAFDGARVLINCAGPFTDVGPPVLRAAIDAGVHYLDTTGEQAYMKWARDEMGPRAEEHGLVVMPGCAFEYATGNFAASLAVDAGARRIALCYATDGMGMSHGTKKSVLRALSSLGYTYVDGRLEPRKDRR